MPCSLSTCLIQLKKLTQRHKFSLLRLFTSSTLSSVCSNRLPDRVTGVKIVEQSYVIMLGGRLPRRRKTKEYVFWPENRSRSLKKFEKKSRALRTVFDWELDKTVIYKVVAYTRWSLMRSGCYERVDCNLVLVMADSLTYQHQHLTKVRYKSAYSSQSLTIGRQECLSAHLKIARWLDTIIVANLVDTWSDRRNDVTRSLCAIFNWPRQGRVLSPPADRERTLETRLWPLPSVSWQPKRKLLWSERQGSHHSLILDCIPAFN